MVTGKINLGVALAISAMAMIGCGQKSGSAAPQQTAGTTQQYRDPVCFEADTPEYITGRGEYRGSSKQEGELVIQATERAKFAARQKLGGQYKGIISDYRNSMGNNQGNDLVSKMESAGDQAIDRELNDVMVVCTIACSHYFCYFDLA